MNFQERVAFLEAQLLKLGKLERDLEDALRELRVVARAAVRDGNLDIAEAACERQEALLPGLTQLQAEIMQIERLLYGLRRVGSG